MGWIDKLLGREPTSVQGTDTNGFSKRGWQSDSEEKQAATTRAYLEAVGRALGVEDMTIVPRPQDSDADLRGSLHGFPLRVKIDYSGRCEDIVFKIGDTGARFIDIEFEPKMPDYVPEIDAFETSEKQVILAPRVFLEGSSADDEAAEFRTLPAELQARVLRDVPRLRIRYFRSRSEEFDITMHDDASEVADPVGWLVDTIQLALDVTRARGQVPPSKVTAGKVPGLLEHARKPRARELADAIARQQLGAKVVDRETEKSLDVRWMEGDVPLRIVLDYGFDNIEVEARADGVPGAFSLQYDPDVSVEKAAGAEDAWDELDLHVFFARSVFVSGRDARTEAAILQSLGTSLLDELVRAVEALEVYDNDFEDQLLKSQICEFADITDGGTALLRFAKLLARVVKALPHGPVSQTVMAVRCAYCHGLWFPSPSHVTCSHCGARS